MGIVGIHPTPTFHRWPSRGGGSFGPYFVFVVLHHCRQQQRQGVLRHKFTPQPVPLAQPDDGVRCLVPQQFATVGVQRCHGFQIERKHFFEIKMVPDAFQEQMGDAGGIHVVVVVVVVVVVLGVFLSTSQHP